MSDKEGILTKDEFSTTGVEGNRPDVLRYEATLDLMAKVLRAGDHPREADVKALRAAGWVIPEPQSMVRISQKYWGVARALAQFLWGDASMADHILDAANGTTYEPDDEDLAPLWDQVVAQQPRELPDFVIESR